MLKDDIEFFRRKASKDGLDYICKPCKRELDRKWSKINREKKSASDRKWREKNSEHVRSYFASYRKRKRNSDPIIRLKGNLQKRIYKALKGIAKSSNTESLLGTTIDQVKKHLESQFIAGMNWENYGKWHVDHIKPLSTAKNMLELEKLFHFTNLQPLWALDNLKKSDTYQEIK